MNNPQTSYQNRISVERTIIRNLTFEHTKFHDAPNRFEAETRNMADAVGLGAALDYVNKIEIDVIHQYEYSEINNSTGL